MTERTNHQNQANNQERLPQRTIIQFVPVPLSQFSYLSSFYGCPYNQGLASFMNYHFYQMQMSRLNQNQGNTQVQLPSLNKENLPVKEESSTKTKKKNWTRCNAINIKYSNNENITQDPFHPNFKFSQTMKFYDVIKAPVLAQNQFENILNFQKDFKFEQKKTQVKHSSKKSPKLFCQQKSKWKVKIQEQNQAMSQKNLPPKLKLITKQQIDLRKGMHTRSFKRKLNRYDQTNNISINGIQSEQKRSQFASKDLSQNLLRKNQKVESSVIKNQDEANKKNLIQNYSEQPIHNQMSLQRNSSVPNYESQHQYFSFFNNPFAFSLPITGRFIKMKMMDSNVIQEDEVKKEAED